MSCSKEEFQFFTTDWNLEDTMFYCRSLSFEQIVSALPEFTIRKLHGVEHEYYAKYNYKVVDFDVLTGDWRSTYNPRTRCFNIKEEMIKRIKAVEVPQNKVNIDQRLRSLWELTQSNR